MKGDGRTVELLDVAHRIHKILLPKFRKSVPKAASEFVPAFILCRWSIFSYIMDAEKIRENVHVIRGFRNIFLHRRRLLEQLLER